MNITLSDIIVILLSIAFPFVLEWKKGLDKKTDSFVKYFHIYINKEELKKSDNYFNWLNLLSSHQDKTIQYFSKIKIEEQNNPLLLPGRSPRENEWLKYWQKELKKLSKIRVVLNLIKYTIPIAVVILLFII